MSRAERLKDLMRNRTTLEQSLTSKQLFCELYPDLVEQYLNKPSKIPGMSELDLTYRVQYRQSLVQLIRRVKSDDDFRWLSSVAWKDERGKIKEYRYVNLKPSNDSESHRLLDESLDRKEKARETMRRMTEKVVENAMRSEEEREQLKQIAYARRRFRKYKKETRTRRGGT